MQSDETKKKLYALKKFFGEEMRTHDITVNRVKCVTVLSVLYCVTPPFIDVQRLSEHTSDAADCGLASVDEVECQQIIDELERLNLVGKYGPRYAISEKLQIACDNSLAERKWDI